MLIEQRRLMNEATGPKKARSGRPEEGPRKRRSEGAKEQRGEGAKERRGEGAKRSLKDFSETL